MVDDELDPVRTIRSTVADPDPERAARMRARALAGVPGHGAPAATALAEPTTSRDRHRTPDRGRPDEVLRLVPGAPPIEIQLDRVGDGATGGQEPASAPRGSSRRPILVAAAAIVVLALVIGLGVARNGRQQGVVADQPRPTSLADLVANARALADRPLAPDQYSHVALTTAAPFTDIDGSRSTHVVTTETWATPAGAGRVDTSDTVVVDEAGNPIRTFDEGQRFDQPRDIAGFGSFTYDQLRALPTTPAELDAALRSPELGDGSDYRRSVLIGELLLLDSTPPATRVAALELLVSEGATFVDGATDRAGRTGFGIVVTGDDGFTTTYVTDRDGVLIGSYDVVTGMAPEPQNAVAWSSVVERDRVTAID